jgi:hypothetical protein
MTVDDVIDRLLEMRPQGFRNSHLANALGVTPSWASKLIARRLRSGELVRSGSGPGPYVRGTPGRVGGVPTFWQRLTESVRGFVYVRLSLQVPGEGVSSRSLGLALERLDEPGCHYAVIDFEDVESISEGAARELLRFPYVELKAINASADIRRTLRRVAGTHGV